MTTRARAFYLLKNRIKPILSDFLNPILSDFLKSDPQLYSVHILVYPNGSAPQSASGARSVRSADSMDKTSLYGVPVKNNCRDLWCTTSKIFRIIDK